MITTTAPVPKRVKLVVVIGVVVVAIGVAVVLEGVVLEIVTVVLEGVVLVDSLEDKIPSLIFLK